MFSLVVSVSVAYQRGVFDVGNPLDTHGWNRMQHEVSDPANYPNWWSGTLYELEDGDSVDIMRGNGYLTKRYALTGINAPDSGQEAEASKLALYGKLKDKRVYVHWDDINGGVEYATLFVDGVNVNQWMLDNGYAEAE
jgi:endonuclease YncB( thermonuclease family)